MQSYSGDDVNVTDSQNNATEAQAKNETQAQAKPQTLH